MVSDVKDLHAVYNDWRSFLFHLAFFPCTVCCLARGSECRYFCLNLVSWAGSSAKAAHLYPKKCSTSHCFQLISLALHGSSGFQELFMVLEERDRGRLGPRCSFQDYNEVNHLNSYSSTLQNCRFLTLNVVEIISYFIQWNGLGWNGEHYLFLLCLVYDILLYSLWNWQSIITSTTWLWNKLRKELMPSEQL